MGQGTESNSAEETFAIGAVVKMTGLSADNIRVWEKRHGAVVAHRFPSGRRYYTHGQIDRFLLLKQCVDCGRAIGTIAHLSDSDLQDLLKTMRAESGSAPLDRQLTYGLLGRKGLDDELLELPQLERQFAQECEDFSSIHFHELTLTLRPDILIIEAVNLVDGAVKSIIELVKRASPMGAFVIYRFANRLACTALRNQGVHLLRAPVGSHALADLLKPHLIGWSAVSDHGPTFTEGRYPSHVFSAEQLARVAALPNTVDCECPHHLVEILESLKSFERYSGECMNKDDDDKALHGKIQLRTAQARHQLEELLMEVLAAEGIQA